MTPKAYNKLLATIYGLMGLALSVALIILVQRILAGQRDTDRLRFEKFYVIPIIPLALLFLSTSYGLFMKRRWARFLSFVVAGVLIRFFPIGTLLAAVTWAHMRSPAGKDMYTS